MGDDLWRGKEGRKGYGGGEKEEEVKIRTFRNIVGRK